MTGRRVRVQGDLFHGVIPDGAIYIGRAAPGLRKAPWANPFSARQYGRAESLRLYRQWIVAQPGWSAARQALAGRDLACWCPLQPELGWTGPWCHGDVLLDLLAQPA